MICDICGARMLHYEAGEEWRCPDRVIHAQILAKSKRGNRDSESNKRDRDSKGKFRKK